MAVMSSVDTDLRAQANAVSVFVMHLFGDFPSPYVIGVVNQYVGEKWGILMLTCWLVWAVIAWGVGWFLAVKAAQRESVMRGGGRMERKRLLKA